MYFLMNAGRLMMKHKLRTQERLAELLAQKEDQQEYQEERLGALKSILRLSEGKTNAYKTSREE